MDNNQYMVVSENDYALFVHQVNQCMAAGWVPSGGVAVTQTVTPTVVTYYQALVKYGPQPRSR